MSVKIPSGDKPKRKKDNTRSKKEILKTISKAFSYTADEEEEEQEPQFGLRRNRGYIMKKL